jgi:hypothetical protein
MLWSDCAKGNNSFDAMSMDQFFGNANSSIGKRFETKMLGNARQSMTSIDLM